MRHLGNSSTLQCTLCFPEKFFGSEGLSWLRYRPPTECIILAAFLFCFLNSLYHHVLSCSRSSNSMTPHTLIIFPFYTTYLWVDLKLLQLFAAVVVKKYSSPHCPYGVAIEVSCLPWWLCSYFIQFFCPYFFPNTLIASVKTLGLLGVFLSRKPSQVAVF